MINVKHLTKFTVEALGDKPVLDIMKDGCEVLDFLGVTYWVSAGSTLGLVREREGYIKYDTDIDVEVLCDEKFDELKLRDTMLDNGFKIIRRMTNDNDVMQLAFIKEDIIFDIYFYYDNNTTNYVNYNEHGTLLMPRRFVINRGLYEKLNKRWVVPTPVEEYLEYRYGVNWRIPTGKKMNWKDTTGDALQ